ncbi:MAG: hypothetical protein FRX49_01220 [Trebouxia sp. A1-2]|nr:MAG: hypothetical protein FRX49_01220 [Trebouxia sp. A1-2]
MAEQQHDARTAFSAPAESASTSDSELGRRLEDFLAYVGNHEYSRGQAVALLQLAVGTAEAAPTKKSIQLQWRNIYAAIATLTRTDSETLHARLTIGFSPAEFKWMLQNKALYTWHSSPVRFQRCLQCMVAKLGNALRPPRNIALTMAKTAAKQPIGPPELDAHISMYEPAKWPLTKRDQTYLSQANKFWNFISTDAFLAITERSQLLDLTHRACTKRYILYMHKMNKRGNVRAAVDLHCLGLSPCQTQAQPGGTQAYGAAESETEQQVSGDSGSFAAAAGSMASEQRLSLAALGSEAASHLASGTLSGLQLSGDPALQSDVPESPLGTPSARRSSRLGPSRFAPPGSVMPSAMQETDEPPSAGDHDWVNPSDELLASLREELDLDLRDAPDDSDDGGSRAGVEGGPIRKCRPWHWLQEMRRFNYERQVMPKDQKKKRKRPVLSGPPSGATITSPTAPQEISQPQRRQPPRRKAQQQFSLDSGSSDDNSPVEQEELSREEEDVPPEPTRRSRSARGVNPNTRHGAGQLQSPFEVGQTGMARAVQGRPAAAVASLDLPFNIPYSSRGATEFESSQAFGDNLQQRYFPPVHSAPTSSLFTHAVSPTPLFRQAWGTVDHGGQHTQQGGLTHLLPHNSAPPTFGGGTGFSQALQPPSLFQLAQGDQQRSSVFGHGDQQRNQGMHHMGQLEQHYLRHLQLAGTTRTGSTNPTGGTSSVAPGLRPSNLQPSRNLDWMELQAQQLGTLPRLGQASAFDSNAQVAMNLDELSALLQAGQAHQTVQQPQPPQTVAQTYLTRLRANYPMRTQSGPLLGYGSTGQSHYTQSSSFTGWGHMQMPQLQLQSMHHMRDPVSSASEPRHEGHLQGSVLGNDLDTLNEPPQDDPD